ncbi:hypothetical protein [Sphaerisporangium flaviroseum]
MEFYTVLLRVHSGMISYIVESRRMLAIIANVCEQEGGEMDPALGGKDQQRR